MEPAFLDTNIILRYLLRDDEAKAQRCLALLEKAERGEISLQSSDLVIAEVVWVLQAPTTYNLPREKIRDLLLPIIMLRGLKLPNKRLHIRAFQLYVDKNIDFIDAYHAAFMERRRLKKIYSYDTDFEQLESIKRLEP